MMDIVGKGGCIANGEKSGGGEEMGDVDYRRSVMEVGKRKRSLLELSNEVHQKKS